VRLIGVDVESTGVLGNDHHRCALIDPEDCALRSVDRRGRWMAEEIATYQGSRQRGHRREFTHITTCTSRKAGKYQLTMWLDVATIFDVKTVSIRDAKNRLTELARTVENGETIVVTRNGRPVFDLVPHKPQRGLRLEALAEFKRRNGIKRIVMSMPADFDDPLPEDVLIQPLPPPK
jgi:prevent-host-death family protein